jgi:hypothetical protein
VPSVWSTASFLSSLKGMDLNALVKARFIEFQQWMMNWDWWKKTMSVGTNWNSYAGGCSVVWFGDVWCMGVWLLPRIGTVQRPKGLGGEALFADSVLVKMSLTTPWAPSKTYWI